MMTALAMTWTMWSIWLGLALLGIVGSALFSGLETGVYSLNRVRLHLLAQRSDSSAAILAPMIRRPNRMLGTLLYGNNIANYLASYAIAVLLAAQGFGDWAQVLINATILTPLLFVFGEVLPKDLFANFSDRLTYPFARMLYLLQGLLMLTGLVPLIDLISRLIGRVLSAAPLSSAAFHPRVTINQLFKEGLGRGVLSAQQTDIIERVLHPTETMVGQAMVNWPAVTKVRPGQPPEALWALANRVPYSRFPVVDSAERVLGVLHIHDVLLSDPADCPPPEQLATPAPKLTPQTPLRSALAILRQNQSAMGIVMEQDRAVGLVTLKDLVEPITGDLAVW
jgi:CBS domain containing-hemolysin-like protein